MTNQERPVEEQEMEHDDTPVATETVAGAVNVLLNEVPAVTADEPGETAEEPGTADEVQPVELEAQPAAEAPAVEAVETPTADLRQPSEVEPPAAEAPTAAEAAETPTADLHQPSEVEPPAAEAPAVEAVETPTADLRQPSEVEPPAAEVPTTAEAAETPTADLRQPSEVEPPAAEAPTTAEQPAAEPPPIVPIESMPGEIEPAEAEAPAEAEPPTAEAVETPAAEQAIALGESAAAPSEADTSAASEATGASYTPAEKDETGRPRRVKDLEVGMELEGRVTSIALYGIFVDIGVGRDGLVHISEMSDTRIESPSDLVKIGDPVTVRVKSVEPDGRRISLTMRSRERGERGRGQRKKPELNRERLAQLRVGDTVEGTVTGIAPFGVFVDIGVGKDGLVHISELSEGRIEKAEEAVQVGQSYVFKLLEVDAEGTRISLSLRRAQREQKMQGLEKGQIIEGTVSGLAPFGAFVDVGVGRDGLIHISELSEQRIERVEDAVTVGDKVTVRVLGVDPQSKRISLSLRLDDKPREAPARPDRAPRPERGPRPERSARPERSEEASSGDLAPQVEEGEEEQVGDATLEDLLSKYGTGSRREKRRRRDDEEEEDDDRTTRRQRDAIRRTLHQLGEDE